MKRCDECGDSERVSDLRFVDDERRTGLFCYGCVRERQTDELNTPSDLSPRGKLAHEIITRILRSHGMTYTGGGTPFYSPKAWCERGEQYGRSSHLIVTYDGGDLRDAFYPDGKPYPVYEEIVSALASAGMFYECCTGWYSAVYDL